MTESAEALAEKVRQVIWLAEDEHAIEADQSLTALVARLAEAEKERDTVSANWEAADKLCDRYRIEADEALREYDALELDAGIMAEALAKIDRRTGVVTNTETGVDYRSKPEWTAEGAYRIAHEALESVSDRARAALDPEQK